MWSSTEVILRDLSAVHRPVLKHKPTNNTHTHTHSSHANSSHTSSCLSSLCFSTGFIRSSAHAHLALSEIFCTLNAPVGRSRWRAFPARTDSMCLTSCSRRRRCPRWPGRVRTRARWRSLLSHRWTRSSRTSLLLMMRSGGERDWVTWPVTRCWSGQGRGRAHACASTFTFVPPHISPQLRWKHLFGLIWFTNDRKIFHPAIASECFVRKIYWGITFENTLFNLNFMSSGISFHFSSFHSLYNVPNHIHTKTE